MLIAYAAPTGGGKTMSAMRTAKGICGSEPFAVIDTEARRSLHYADQFRFDFVDFKPPFSPDRYVEAIIAAEAKGYKAIVTDSFSHSHAGEGGVLDMQEAELEELVGLAIARGDTRKDWQIRDAYRQLSWQKPKKQYKRMVEKFLQCRSHLIFCLRAEDKVEFQKDEHGKTIVVEKKLLSGFKGWIPICDRRFLFELTASFLLLPDAPGVPHAIKLQEQHKPFFPEGKVISDECGRLIAAWAAGGKARTLNDDEIKDLEIQIQEARTEAELKKCGERCRLAPAFEQGRLRDLYVAALEKLRGGRVSS